MQDFQKTIPQFLLRVALFSCVGLLPFLIFLCIVPDEKTDPYYYKLASPRQSSLIIGASRSANGLRPDVFNVSGIGEKHPMFNFAFENIVSPYSEEYLEAITKKIDPSVADGLFIMGVSPMSISIRRKDKTSKEWISTVKENNILSNLFIHNIEPNPEYFIRNYRHPFYRMLVSKFDSNPKFLGHKDGWYEQLVKPKRTVKDVTAKPYLRADQALRTYKEPSVERMNYLKQTIEFLQGHGQVFLVRMPVNPNWILLEDNYWADFDDTMEAVAVDFGVQYINLFESCQDCDFFDGHHLMGKDSEKISQMVVSEIVKFNTGEE